MRESRDIRYRRQARRNLVAVALLLSAALVARMMSGTGCGASSSSSRPAPPLPSRERIVLRFDEVELLDADTARVRGHSVRFLGCDAPEVAGPYHEGDQEPWASRATDFVRESLRTAGRIELIVVEQQDRYGRLLGHFFVDGDSVSLRLVRAGLAYETISRFGDYGFEELGKQLQAAAAEVTPAFEKPATWRAAHRFD
ncbi:MAG: thermonuclease family protein [Planctomycetota bacterium]